ncbi:BCCT family transporter [Vibrio cincinnatiensis]|jgi:BCCT family betaine/carnitine transporter|uniref:Betaine/carnitine transporter, BCCT family n=1 Tax=Vibrio cincinnatiensis DSM 19608 TaxID=1123491 RepID=A0A1T4RZV3_VIBCI|nr:BCCT family transporter [Vibrio cincinnatiensis]MCG3733830.1 BCCT family transporter [Vibrio cincinnatiensis]MCG3736624.1 BCCT family transporter [Vibrio cincinnatiensis]MCG3741014.1 BCCT family transporter [Vibrio cincinnatiensis]MCG3744618.1 BCCT family transporter [Vibrio cincinnatiensis]MCG3747096.1 BCCT family transporter [Vibrio cincinnatiensis]
MEDALKKYSIETTDYRVGQDNVQKWGFDVHNPVFGISAGLILFFLLSVIWVGPSTAKEMLDTLKNGIIQEFDAFFMWITNFFLFFALVLMVSPLGKIRLGGKEATPDHSRLSWLSMLFAAGMGIGLLFWSVAEPTAYYTNWWGTPFNVAANTPEAQSLAMGATLFHWGIHGWSIYAIVALSLGFFAFNKGLPLSIRSVFYPIFGDRAWGWLGHIIDIMAVLATLFGLATSLGLGAQQATSGINYIFGTNGGIGMQFTVIVFVTLIAIISVFRGINGGVKVLSNINMLLAFALLIFMIMVSFDTTLQSIPDTFMAYIENIIPLSNPHGREDEIWMHGWTVFYWAWWISWSPFVGMFIARVSRGRTVREFILAVVFIPTLLILIWMAVFGGVALDQVANHIGELGAHGLTDISLTLFHVYEQLPLGSIISIISIGLILIFFITSADSGSLVIDSITAGGKVDAPVLQRIFWATIGGAIAAVMLWVGGSEALQALQSGVVATALPFSFVLLLMCVSLIQGLRTEQALYH